MPIPQYVQDLIAGHLRELDRTVPGLVPRLYLTGSIALGDFRPGHSDIDFMAVTSRPADAEERDALAKLHTQMPTEPHYDGVYLDPAEFAARLDDEEVVPHIVNGEFHTDQPCGELNPVLWLTLARYGIAVRGPAVTNLGVRVQPLRLRRWNLANLKRYWQPLAHGIRQLVADRPLHAPANPVGIVWTVLGPARLHYTLATGDVTSKTGAGRYAAERFPDWAELAERALAARLPGVTVSFTTADALASADMVDAIVTDAWQRWA